MIGERVASGAETGLQVAVLHEGEVVADAVAGLADPHTAAPVTADTLFFAASTGKGVAASVAHTLVDRGALSYDQRVADIWPEFSAHGKDRVTLRDVLLHTAGVPGLWPQITPDELCDWDRVCAFIADQPPWWPPGTATGYHALTFGFVLGELVRRATGRTLAEMLREEIAAPLVVAGELHFGVPDELLARVARQGPEGAAPPPPEPGSPLDRVIPPGVQPTAGFANRHDVLRADIPSQGTMSAASRGTNVRRASRSRGRRRARLPRAPRLDGRTCVLGHRSGDGIPNHVGAWVQSRTARSRRAAPWVDLRMDRLEW